MGKVILEGYIQVPENNLELIKKELLNHIQLTRAEVGCIVFTVEPSVEDKCRFYVYEEFDSQESFESHQLRVKQSHWGRITQAVQREYKMNSI